MATNGTEVAQVEPTMQRQTVETSAQLAAVSKLASTADGISAKEAVAVAVGHVGQGGDIERDYELGGRVWHVEVVHQRQEIEVDVVARDGKVLRVEREARDGDDRYED
ncbi:MAG: PepSY domain-containing protein [Thermocrispum agreste]|uniref:PepSY domain-containing protein n=1 Tax=Thermocrispum agreste TaxID=37925 RepID=A0ABD6FKK0_9PSEU